MKINEINENVFDEFAKTHILNNFNQTSSYGKFMDKTKYEVIYIGAYYEKKLIAASMILYKYIAPTIKYGYAPKGFLLDYSNKDLLSAFTKKIKSFFSTKGFAFIKINPEIIYSKVDYINNKKIINTSNKELVSFLRTLGYEKLRDNLYFESMLPKYNPIINLKTFSKNNVSEICLNRINSISVSSLTLKKCNSDDLNKFYEFVKEKTNRTLKYYKDFYDIFKKNEMVDLLMVEIDYRKHLEVFKTKYEKIAIQNEIINDKFNNNPKNVDLYNNKMASDRELSNVKHTIDIINDKIRNGVTNEYIGGSLLVKYTNRVNLLISGFDDDLLELSANYFLYYNFLEYYKKLNYTFFDLNGITGNFKENNPFKKLNDFKLSFYPTVYEYIGEFDLVINNIIYNTLWKTGKLEKEFKN